MIRRNKRTEIYLEAARRIAEWEDLYSCVAITNAQHKEPTSWTTNPVVAAYERAFNPKQVQREDYDKQRDIRVMMLCQMAWAWKDLK